MRPGWLAALLAACGTCSACGDRGQAAEPVPVPLEARVADHRRAPLGGAAIDIDGAAAGVTGEDGVVRTELGGPDGRSVEVALRCPEGLVPDGDRRRELTLRRMRPVAAAGDGLAPLETGFVCAPALREHLLVVRADGRAGLPVLVNGEKAADTGPSGIAHAVLRQPPGDEVEIVIDTEAEDDLRPRSPSRRLRLPRESRVVLFDQRFDERKPRPAARRRGTALPRRL